MKVSLLINDRSHLVANFEIQPSEDYGSGAMRVTVWENESILTFLPINMFANIW